MAQDNEDIADPNNWRGLNLLGFTLMEVRDFLKKHGHFNYLQNVADVPWKKHPDIDPLDIFWRMGNGEDLAYNYYKYYESLSDFEKTILKLTITTPYHWRDFYTTG